LPTAKFYDTQHVIEGMYDVMGWGAPFELWQKWEQPEIWRLPQGHISTALTALMPGLPGCILRWLAPQLEMPAILRPIFQRSHRAQT
jgi:hypothetical protein